MKEILYFWLKPLNPNSLCFFSLPGPHEGTGSNPEGVGFRAEAREEYDQKGGDRWGEVTFPGTLLTVFIIEHTPNRPWPWTAWEACSRTRWLRSVLRSSSKCRRRTSASPLRRSSASKSGDSSRSTSTRRRSTTLTSINEDDEVQRVLRDCSWWRVSVRVASVSFTVRWWYI